MANLLTSRDVLYQLEQYRWILQTNSIEKRYEKGRKEGRITHIRPSCPRGADAMAAESPWHSVEEIAKEINVIGQRLLQLPAVYAAENAEELRVIPFLVQEITSLDQAQIGLLGKWLFQFPPLPPLPIGPAAILFGAHGGVAPR